jgi:LuxR family transcriptional regulator, activator of tox operons
MHIFRLPSSSGCRLGPLRRLAPQLIAASGTPGFEPMLFEAAHEATACEHLTAFAFSGAARPRVLLACNTGAQPVARWTAEKYISKYWTLDPLSQIDPPRAFDEQELGVRVHSEDIGDSDYKEECYTAVGLKERVSLVQSRNDETFRINFYKSGTPGCFAPEEVDRIFEASDLIMSLLAKHDSTAPAPRGPGAAAVFQRRLEQLGKSLPKREIEVCSRIATGMSSEGIGLDLGISLNTVLTHRKRAYARLRISSQNELLRLLLS